jgi:UDP-2,3-diacylglucosamine pyrophosphatase LpxH
VLFKLMHGDALRILLLGCERFDSFCYFRWKFIIFSRDLLDRIFLEVRWNSSLEIFSLEEIARKMALKYNF